jgi:hypothetical protein
LSTRIDLGPSLRLAVLLAFGHATALLSAVALLPGLAATSAALAIGLSWVDCWRKHVYRSAPDAVTTVTLGVEGVTLYRRNGAHAPGAVLSRFVAPGLVVLRVRPEGSRWSVPVVIASDATGAAAHRRLRVWLNWQGTAGDDPGRV